MASFDELEGLKKHSNLYIDNTNSRVIVLVNPNIYPIDVVYHAAYVNLDKSYIVIDGSPNDGILVEIIPKKPKDLLELGRDFNNDLLNYAMYKVQTIRNSRIKEMLLDRALFTNTVPDEIAKDN